MNSCCFAGFIQKSETDKDTFHLKVFQTEITIDVIAEGAAYDVLQYINDKTPVTINAYLDEDTNGLYFRTRYILPFHFIRKEALEHDGRG